MSFRFLLDTNVLYEPVRPNPNRGTMRGLATYRLEIVTAAPVWNELLFGCYRLPPSARRRTLEHYLHQTLGPALPVLPYDSEAAQWHAAERARLGGAGLTPSYVDGAIAAITFVNGLTLVTRNVADYANFQGLRIANWHEEA